MTRSFCWARYCTWLATRKLLNVEIDEWSHNKISSTFRNDRFAYCITLTGFELMAHIWATLFCPPSFIEHLRKCQYDHGTVIYQTEDNELIYLCGSAVRPKRRGQQLEPRGQCWDINSPSEVNVCQKPRAKVVKVFCLWWTFAALTVDAKESLQQDRYCITSFQFWDAPIVPYVARFIVKMDIPATPLD